MKIAVYLNGNDETIPVNSDGVVKVYLKENGEWKVIEEINVKLSNLESTGEIRNNIMKMAETLNDCKVFVAENVKGIPFTILEGLRFNIWKVKGKPKDFLDYVMDKEEQEKQEKVIRLSNESIPVPRETEEKGKYFIDLKDIMENNEKVTSKKVLKPFFNEGQFKELKIICSHIPPWFKGEFERLNLKSESKTLDNGSIEIIVYK